jgi:hypothetical protein
MPRGMRSSADGALTGMADFVPAVRTPSPHAPEPVVRLPKNSLSVDENLSGLARFRSMRERAEIWSI